MGGKDIPILPSLPFQDMQARGNFCKIWMKKRQKGRDEKNFSGLTLKIEVTDSCALLHQEFCIRTRKQALGTPVVLVDTLNSTDAAVQSDISKDYIRCFLINVSFVFSVSFT